MMIITVDKKSCFGDGKCVEICPIQILQMNEKERVPEFVPNGNDVCINCGHCFSVCPSGAIKLSTMEAKDSLSLDHSKLRSNRLSFLCRRRSVRRYKEESVAQETIAELLDVARYAPSGINRQPVNWAVLLGKEKVHDLGGLLQWMEGLLAAKAEAALSFNFGRLVDAWKKGKDLICRDAPCIVTRLWR